MRNADALWLAATTLEARAARYWKQTSRWATSRTHRASRPSPPSLRDADDTRTRKRQRAAPEANEGRISNPSQYVQHTGASLASIPPELKRRIIDFACLASSSSSTTAAAASSRSCFFDSDVPTMLSLNLVCRELHNYVQPKLYRQITIARPSTLYALTQTFSANPERAQLVQAIHIGPQDVLPRSWWPVQLTCREAKTPFGAPESNINSQVLETSLDPTRLPSGCAQGHAWSLTLTPSGCRDEAVYKALKTAQHSLGLNLVRGIPQVGPLRIDRVLEMQAVLDLYLQHLKVLEDGSPDLARLAQAGARVPLACRNGKCSHYPTLVLKDMPAPYTISPNPPPATQANVFVLRYTQLLHHLARRGSITDRFDHPLLFERSGHSIAKLPNPDGSPVGHGYQLNPIRITWIFGGDRETANWPQLAFLNSIVNGTTSSPREKAFTRAVIAAGSVESCLRLARTLLASTTSLKVLSLTGFLQTAVDSHSVRLLRLRRLSLGPPPPGWHGLIRVAEVEQVENLRLCNVSLGGREIQDLTSKLSMLRRLEWVMGRKVESGSGLT